MSTVDPIADRRQRAREAYYDHVNLIESHDERLLDDAIEVATQVKITDDIVEALHAVTIARGSEQLKTIAEAAFRAAGFEVVE